MKAQTPQRVAIERIAALVLLNAMIFQEVLAQTHPKVRPLNASYERTRSRSRRSKSTGTSYFSNVNYFPIFHIAHELLLCLSSLTPLSSGRCLTLSAIARQVVGWRASLRHDLAGRIYHRLLTEAKYLGAYYTSIPAAALLAKLALERRG